MQLRLRPLLLATGALLLTAANASAQFIELLTESPVTFQVTLTTMTAVDTTATERATTATTFRLSHTDVINELRNAGIIPSSPETGWTLVAVNAAPADLEYLSGAFFLYAVNGDTRIQVPSTKFSATNLYEKSETERYRYGLVGKYTEKYQGQYVLSSSGTATAHASYSYLPSLTLGNNTLVVDQSLTDGFATIGFTAKDDSNGYEVFFYAPTSIRASTRGGFTGTLDVGGAGAAPTTGLVTLSITVGTPKLVPASLYPEVHYFFNATPRS